MIDDRLRFGRFLNWLSARCGQESLAENLTILIEVHMPNYPPTGAYPRPHLPLPSFLCTCPLFWAPPASLLCSPFRYCMPITVLHLVLVKKMQFISTVNSTCYRCNILHREELHHFALRLA